MADFIQRRIVNLTNHPIFPMSFGGTRVVHGFVQGLGLRNHRVSLIAWRTGQEPPDSELSYRLVPIFPEWGRSRKEPIRVRLGNQVKGKWPGLFAAYWFVRWRVTYLLIGLVACLRSIELLRRERAEILVVDYPFLGFSAWVAARLSGVRFVVHSHNIEYERLRSLGSFFWRCMKPYEQWVYRRADRVLFITENDANFACEHLKLDRSKVILCPYGGELEPLALSRSDARHRLGIQLSADQKMVLYFGRMDYSPNIEGFELLCNQILPRLKDRSLKFYVCGIGLPPRLQRHPAVVSGDIVYLGFVPSIETYLVASDLVINPILSGGGLKTKVVEAIAQNRTVVATHSGAQGVDSEVCGTKLVCVQDGDWDGFTDQMRAHLEDSELAPSRFFEKYNFSKILPRVEEELFN